MSKYYRVYADVDLDAIRANCIELMSKTEPSTKALAVVKADGYGHGDVAVSKAVRDLVYGYAVATLDDAEQARALVLGGRHHVFALIVLVQRAAQEDAARVLLLHVAR